ncbi:hypothetical protein SRHO_G00276250 [Serrasalmus rhombeus]
MSNDIQNRDPRVSSEIGERTAKEPSRGKFSGSRLDGKRNRASFYTSPKSDWHVSAHTVLSSRQSVSVRDDSWCEEALGETHSYRLTPSLILCFKSDDTSARFFEKEVRGRLVRQLSVSICQAFGEEFTFSLFAVGFNSLLHKVASG